MARKKAEAEKKITVLSEEEQPYELPEGWIWTKLGSVISLSKEKKEEFSLDDKYVGLENIEKDTNRISFESSKDIKSTKSVFNNGDLLYGRLRPYLNKHGIALFDGICSTDILVFNSNDMITLRLVNYVFNLPSFIKYAVSNSKGINLPRVSADSVLKYPFPLPPLEVQQNIVTNIESLFSKLDKAKEKVQSVLDGSELRRSAILHKAFSGELTEKWREENGVDFDSWKEITIGEILLPIKVKFEPYQNNGYDDIKYIGLEHIQKGEGIIGYGDASDVKSIRTIFKKGDILYGKLRPYLDKHDIARFDGICSTDILVYRAKEEITSFYCNYLMGTTAFIEYAVNNSQGINLPRTSEKIISAFELQIPTISEQQEIVRLLDSLLTKEATIKSTCEKTLATIDTMKQSILAKAFRGELVANV